MKVYIVIEPGEVPQIIGVYRKRTTAERVAYEKLDRWRNVIEKKVEGVS